MPGEFQVFAATLAFGAAHSLLASTAAKRAVRERLGPWIDRYYRIAFNALAAAVLVPWLVVLIRNIGPVLVVVPWPWSAAMVLVQLGALLLMAASFLQSDPLAILGLKQLTAPAVDNRLNGTGFYAVVRHPMYSAGLLFLWCCPIITTGTLALDMGVTLYILIGSELEERRLIKQFGDEYRRYRSRVARLIPFLF
jgi:protein-S-isoprenylcysteine O-methyltransferase Ste14